MPSSIWKIRAAAGAHIFAEIKNAWSQPERKEASSAAYAKKSGRIFWISFSQKWKKCFNGIWRGRPDLKKKIESLLGFAARARAIRSGSGTCSIEIKRGKAKLLIIAEDAAENTVKKMSGEAKSRGVEYRIYGSSDELSHITGQSGKATFVITDANFAECILAEIDEK